MNNNNTTAQIKSNNTAEASNLSDRSEKRSVDQEIDAEIKKMKIETPLLEQKASVPAFASNIPPKLASAATIASVAEITDDELLQYTLEFERKHGI